MDKHLWLIQEIKDLNPHVPIEMERTCDAIIVAPGMPRFVQDFLKRSLKLPKGFNAHLVTGVPTGLINDSGNAPEGRVTQIYVS